MAYDSAYPFPIASARPGANGDLDGALGTLFITKDGKGFRLCKASSVAVATAAGRALAVKRSSKATGNQPTWILDPTQPTKYVNATRVVIPPSQVGTGATSTTLAANDYFWGQVSGPITALKTLSGLTANPPLVAQSTGICVALTAGTAATAVKAVIGYGTNTATTTAGTTTSGAFLTGLI